MCRTLVCCLIISLILIGCAVPQHVVQKSKTICGIIPFESRSGMQPGETESVMDIFAASLQKTGRFIVIERKQMNAILEEHGFQSAQDNQTGMARAAKILAVNKMISGSIGKLDGKYMLHLKMIDIHTSERALAISRMYDGDIGEMNDKFLPMVVNEVLSVNDSVQKVS
jgi:TolB-like protein